MSNLKSFRICGAMILALAIGQAHADPQCEGTGTTRIDWPQIRNLLQNQLVCAWRPGEASNPSRRWSEIHNGNGQAGSILGEHGRGNTDTAGSYDSDIGTWELIDTGFGNNQPDAVLYTYTGDGPYVHALYRDNTTDNIYFCDGSTLRAISADDGTKIQSIPDPTLQNPCGW